MSATDKQISHEWVLERLPRWADPDDHTLNEDQRIRLEQHLADCASCQKTAQTLRAVYEKGTSEERRAKISQLELNRTASWETIQQRQAASINLEADPMATVWKQAAVWLLAGLLTGGILTARWTSSQQLASNQGYIETTESGEWETLEEAVNQQWVNTSLNWTQMTDAEQTSGTQQEK
jgi:anti-sigma factor RsiW